MSRLSLSLIVAVLATPSAFAAVAGDVALREARRLSTQFLFNESLEQYRVAERTGADPAEARFGQALALLNVQPQRAANLTQAAALLDALINEATDGDLGVAARYFRARIAHPLQSSAPPLEAAERYAALYRDHPEHRWGQQAMVKLAIFRLYDPTDATPRAALVEELAAVAEAFCDPVARRDLHLTLGGAAQFFELSSDVALHHLMAAKDAGIEGHASRGNVLVAIGELARELGRHEVAKQHYEEFLKRHQRDNRAFTIRQRLAGLPQSDGALTEENQP